MSRITKGSRRAAAFLAFLLSGALGARAEVIEEIVAKVDDEIITKSDLDTAEQEQLAELYRRYAGKELDDQVKGARANLLRSLIDQKVLLHRASRLYDLDKMGEAILSEFRERQQIKNDQELERLLVAERMTLDDLKRRLVEMTAPGQVLRYEVYDRIAVSEKDLRAYYDGHPEEFEVPAEAVVREIVLLTDDGNRSARRLEAESVRRRVTEGGEPFEKVAAEVSDAGTKSSGGLLGPQRKGDLSPHLEAIAFSLPVSEVSPIIEAPYGFHLIRVDSRQEAGRLPYEGVKEDLRKRLEQERAAVGVREFLKKAWDESTIEVMPRYQSQMAPFESPMQTDTQERNK